MSPITHALIDYWQRLPAHPVARRRASLDEVLAGVRAGELEPGALVPYALADVDEEVVFAATREYLDAREGTGAGGEQLADALEWIRRGLALNRGAVFAALLSLGEPEVNASLARLRLTLEAPEVEVVCRWAAVRGCAVKRDFLRGWLELLAGAPREREQAYLAAALTAD
jgi:hypothetical protein